MKLSILLLFTLCACGCASDRLAGLAEHQIKDQHELWQCLGRPDRIVKVDGGTKWTYHSHGFRLMPLEFWDRQLTCLIDEAGKVTRQNLTGISRQYHLTMSASRPEGFDWMLSPAADWTEDASLNAHHLAGAEYVMIGDIAALYNLGPNRSGSRTRAIYQTASAQLALEANHHEIQINGVEHGSTRLSYPRADNSGSPRRMRQKSSIPFSVQDPRESPWSFAHQAGRDQPLSRMPRRRLANAARRYDTSA